MKSIFRQVLQSIFLLAVALVVPASAGQIVGGTTYKAVGNTNGDETATSGCSSALWTTAADVVSNYGASKRFFTKQIDAALSSEAHKSSGKAGLKLNGQTVASSSGKFSKQFGPYLASIKTPTLTFSLGWVSLKASAELGGGTQAGITVDYTTSPMAARLTGAAQFWAFGAGTVSVQILAGLASAKVSIDATFFNHTLHFDLRASAGAPVIGSVRLEMLPWTIKVKVKAEVLGITVASSNIVDREGTPEVRQLL